MKQSRADNNNERQFSAASHRDPVQRSGGNLAHQVANKTSAPPSHLDLQQAVNNSPKVSQLEAYQAMADSRSDRNTSLAGSDRGPLSKPSYPLVATSNSVTQLAADYQVAHAIGWAESPAAAAKQEIINDLTAETGGKTIDFAESDGTPWIQAKAEVKSAAKRKGYSEEAATRLIEKNPYEKKDIKGKSSVMKDLGAVTTFQGVMDDFVPQIHQLYFHNTYKEGKWVMEDNFRNPFLANFFGNDVIEEQKALVTEKGTKPPGELRTLTRTNIVSKSGVKWAKDNSVENGALTADLLTSFLKTENGEHSKKIAKDQGVQIVGGIVSKITTTGATAYKYFEVELRCTPIVVAE